MSLAHNFNSLIVYSFQHWAMCKLKTEPVKTKFELVFNYLATANKRISVFTEGNIKFKKSERSLKNGQCVNYHRNHQKRNKKHLTDIRLLRSINIKASWLIYWLFAANAYRYDMTAFVSSFTVGLQFKSAKKCVSVAPNWLWEMSILLHFLKHLLIFIDFFCFCWVFVNHRIFFYFTLSSCYTEQCYDQLFSIHFCSFPCNFFSITLLLALPSSCFIDEVYWGSYTGLNIHVTCKQLRITLVMLKHFAFI